MPIAHEKPVAQERSAVPTHRPAPTNHSRSSQGSGAAATEKGGAEVRIDNQAAKIAIIDDEPINVKLARKFLQTSGYTNIITTTESREAMRLIRNERPDVVLLDIMMPEISGLDILDQLRADSDLAHIPVLILTAAHDPATKKLALERGATDFLGKPVDMSELILRVRNSLVIKLHHDHLSEYTERLAREVALRTAELARTRLEVIHCLARAAEYRDNETGRHVIRVGRYVGIIARQLGIAEETAELMEHAAPLHDIGKIGIPDSILLKPGRLTPEEFEFMQSHCHLGRRVFDRISSEEWELFRTHTDIGALILENRGSSLMAMAARIAQTHHEKWDGSGYPLALAGEDIPLEGRITAVADVFDALSSKRPYKPALPLEKCLSIMEEGRAKHFDPRVLDAFLTRIKEIVAVQIECADTE